MIKKPSAPIVVSQIISEEDLNRMRGNAQSDLKKEMVGKAQVKQAEVDREEIAARRAQKLKEGDELRKSRMKATSQETLNK